MSDDWLNSYILAGKAVAAAKRLARKIIKPGVPLLQIANLCEEEIYKHNCELSFPINLSLNEIAAHYSPPIKDKTLVPEHGLLKVDVGSHFNGFIADSAITLNIDQDPILQNYIEAAKEALNSAIELFKPGIRLYEIGEVIAEKIINYGLRPITNLGGHELKQYNLHAGPFVPNYKDMRHNEIIKPGQAFACEPFTTSGVGQVTNGKASYIYRFVRKVKKNLSYEEQAYMNKIEEYTKRLPFSPRFIVKSGIVDEAKVKRIIDSFVRKKILDHYPLLIEKTNALVAQEEHTIVIDLDGTTIVTTKE
ncbi:MAG: type II methionyl aminopeptidase [Promethearchaeota archaeon]|nr:MAG: type II methionyl aminopeptidase [Candidatus Lokiarchaeota archaeon]